MGNSYYNSIHFEHGHSDYDHYDRNFFNKIERKWLTLELNCTRTIGWQIEIDIALLSSCYLFFTNVCNINNVQNLPFTSLFPQWIFYNIISIRSGGSQVEWKYLSKGRFTWSNFGPIIISKFFVYDENVGVHTIQFSHPIISWCTPEKHDNSCFENLGPFHRS